MSSGWGRDPLPWKGDYLTGLANGLRSSGITSKLGLVMPVNSSVRKVSEATVGPREKIWEKALLVKSARERVKEMVGQVLGSCAKWHTQILSNCETLTLALFTRICTGWTRQASWAPDHLLTQGPPQARMPAAPLMVKITVFPVLSALNEICLRSSAARCLSSKNPLWGADRGTGNVPQ